MDGFGWMRRICRFQSTSPVRGMTRSKVYELPEEEISIHIPRAGDDRALARELGLYDISIHIPRAGDDTMPSRCWYLSRVFQSTSPVRGMTEPEGVSQWREADFNPHPPCGG